jgi:hypothetical protein
MITESDYASKADVTEAFMRLVPTRTVDWPGGSGAAQYALTDGPVIVLWDSHDYPIVCDVRDDAHAETVWAAITTTDPETWDAVGECELCAYPDTAMTEADLAYLMR